MKSCPPGQVPGEVWGWVILGGGGSRAPCKMLSSIPALTHLARMVTTKNVPRLCKQPGCKVATPVCPLPRASLSDALPPSSARGLAKIRKRERPLEVAVHENGGMTELRVSCCLHAQNKAHVLSTRGTPCCLLSGFPSVHPNAFSLIAVRAIWWPRQTQAASGLPQPLMPPAAPVRVYKVVEEKLGSAHQKRAHPPSYGNLLTLHLTQTQPL